MRVASSAARSCRAAWATRRCSTARSSLMSGHQALYDDAVSEIRSRASAHGWIPLAAPTAAINSGLTSQLHYSAGPSSAAHIRSLTGLFAFAVVAGVGAYYTANVSVRADIPRDVAEYAARAEELLAAGAPSSAAAQFERAVNVLSARGGEPLVLLELLIRMGDAQRSSGQLHRAADTLQRARSLGEAILSLEESTPLPCPPPTPRTWDSVKKDVAAAARVTTSRADVPRLLVAVLDRLAEMHVAAHRVSDAARNYDLCAGIVATHHGDMIRRSREFSAALAAAADDAPAVLVPFTRKTRHHVADFAGMYFNASACALEQKRVAAAREAAVTALRLIGTARASAVADARVLLDKVEREGVDAAEYAATAEPDVEEYPADLRSLVMARVADERDGVVHRLQGLSRGAVDAAALSVARELFSEIQLLAGLQQLAEGQLTALSDGATGDDEARASTTAAVL